MADDEDDDREEQPRKRRRNDDDDDRPRRRSRRSSASDDGGIGYVIPYKNGAALAAYYIGIFGLILCFLPPLSLFSGAAAAVLGFMGMSRASKKPDAHGRGHAITGIVLGIVQILDACAIGAFFAISFMASRKH